MTRWLIHWAVATIALMVLPYLFNGITINEPMTALMAASLYGTLKFMLKAHRRDEIRRERVRTDAEAQAA